MADSAESLTTPAAATLSSLRQLTVSRRSALLGAAALFSTVTPRALLAAVPPDPSPPTPSVILLNGNENPYGPSPTARQAIIRSVFESCRYGDQAIKTLMQAIAAYDQLTIEHLILGSGSSELLRMSAFLAAEGGSGGEVIAATPTYEELPDFATRLGLQVITVPLNAQHQHDLPAMQAAITDKTRLIYICNPNNPTATVVGLKALEDFMRAVPARTRVLIDEAYFDFITDSSAGSVISWVKTYQNLIVTRTFSKIHGLAGLRIGYAYAHPTLAAQLTAKQLAYPNIAGLRAALASLTDSAFIHSTRTVLLADRARIEDCIDRLGLTRTRSQGNFVFFDVRQPLAEFSKKMLAHHIAVGRHFTGYDQWARITVGLTSEVNHLLTALPHALSTSG